MINLVRTNSSNSDFTCLVKLLNADLAGRDGVDHLFYAQFNTLNKVKEVVLTYAGDAVIGCGAIKTCDVNVAEVKRMYVLPGHRRSGVASMILTELENWLKELGHVRCVLETG